MYYRIAILLLPVILFADSYCDWQPFLSQGSRQFSLDQAVQQTLQNQWDIQIAEAQVVREKGLYKMTQGPFDPTWNLDFSQQWWINNTRQLGLSFPPGTVIDFSIIGPHTAEGAAGITLPGQTTMAKTELQKMIRYGTTFAIGAELNKQKNPFFLLNTPFPELSLYEDIFIRQGEASVYFRIDQPLLKGFINGVDRMTELSQQLQVTAAEYDLVDDIAQRILDTADAYWDLVNAWLQLHVQERGELRVSGYVHDIQLLVEKNQTPRTELTLPMSSLSTLKANIASAKQDIIVASQKLIVAMGLEANYSLLCDSDIRFDRLPWPKYKTLPEFQYLIRKATDIALTNRPDIHALEYRQDSIYKQVLGARNSSLPELNITVTGKQSNTNYEQGAGTPFQPFHMIKPEREITAILSLNYPLYRSKGLGEYRALKAEKREVDLQLVKKKASVFSEVIDAINQHSALLKEVIQAEVAVDEGRKYVSDQEKLFKAGITTDVFQLIDAHTRLIDSETRFNNVQTQIAQNIAQIRYDLGLIVYTNQCNKNYSIAKITQMPQELFNEL